MLDHLIRDIRVIRGQQVCRLEDEGTRAVTGPCDIAVFATSAQPKYKPRIFNHG